MAEVQQPQADPIGLFGVGFLRQSLGDPELDVRPDTACPLAQTVRRPLLMFAVPDKTRLNYRVLVKVCVD